MEVGHSRVLAAAAASLRGVSSEAKCRFTRLLLLLLVRLSKRFDGNRSVDGEIREIRLHGCIDQLICVMV